MKKRALISVSDKTNLKEFAEKLVAADFELISTGGTEKFLKKAGLPVMGIEEVTHFPEMLDGRVKTLHPKIHGGLLARRDVPSHLAALVDYEITPIDLVCVNLYPFKETIAKPDITEAEAIEQIDIGGPSMLRSGAKNFASVTVVVDALDYEKVATELLEKGDTTLATRKYLAAKVFRHTASYDALIADYLTTEEFPEKLTPTFSLKQTLRYGENPQQKAAFYEEALPTPFSIAKAQQLHGKELSYNNIKDADAALRIIADFADGPTAVAVKHMNPCGIGQGKDLAEAFAACFNADPVSIFGGIVALNQEVTLEVAEKLHELFLEIVIAPSFAPEAFEILAKKKNLRLMTVDFTGTSKNQKELVSVMGGLLVQEQDEKVTKISDFKVVTKLQPTKDQLKALDFAFKVVKHVKSNAIVVTNQVQTLGIGAGQMNRIGSVELAVAAAKDKVPDLKGAVLASDAFFPMDDSVKYAAEQGIKAIIQPGGSIKDEASIKMADALGIAMVFTGTRHFRH